MTTYFYDPILNELVTRQAFDRLTVSSTPIQAQRPATPELGYYSSAPTTPTSSPLPRSAKMARTVQFGAHEGARDVLCDEKELMRTFHKHVKGCDTCYDNLYDGRPLCSKGHNYVVDMKPYFYCKAGKPYSVIDRNQKSEVTRVLVPAEYKYVSKLFEQLNLGYNTAPSRYAAKPKIVYPSAEPVQAPRRQERPTIIIPTDRHISRSTPRSAQRYHEYREPKSRGSLYHEDERRRHRHHGEEIIYASPRSSKYYL